MEEQSRNQRDLNKGVKVFSWVRFISKGIGVSPLEPNYYLYNICISYFTYIMIIEYIDLYNCLPNFKKVINNLTESLALTQMYVRGVMLRVHIDKLRRITVESLKDYDIKAFKNPDEVYEFLSYIKRGKFFVKSVTIFIFSTTTSWFFRPLTSSTPSTSIIPGDNETAAQFTYVLPYKFHLFYQINNQRTYMLTYMSHAPLPYVSVISAITSATLLIALSFHISGRLAIVARRIKSLKKCNKQFRKDLNEVIFEHTRLLELGEELKTSYAAALLVYLVVGTIQLCMISYQILVLISMGKHHSMMPFFFFIITTYGLIAIYCMLSENLLEESKKCSEAFWSCEWYEMPVDCIKDITFCIMRSQKPLGLTAGAFLTFSNSTLTDVTKTAVGYLSILRKFLLD